jgi:CBS domain-containing protein
MTIGLLGLIHRRPEVAPDATVRETTHLMAHAQIGAIAVRQGATLVGLFTERDLLKRVVAAGRDPDTTLVRDVMTTDIVSVADLTSVADAAAVMRVHHMRHLVIVDEAGHYLGILAQRHLLYELMSELSMKVDDLTGYVMADGPGG